MRLVTVQEAQQHLPELLAAVGAGEIVSILGDDGRTFQLVLPAHAPVINPAWLGYPHPGSAKGLIKVPDDFDEPLDELKAYVE